MKQVIAARRPGEATIQRFKRDADVGAALRNAILNRRNDFWID